MGQLCDLLGARLPPAALPLVNPPPALCHRNSMQPVPVVPLDVDHLCDETVAPVPHQESAGQRLDLHRALVHELAPQHAPQPAAAPDPLDRESGAHLPRAHRRDPLPGLAPAHHRLDPLRRLEAPPCLLELGPCNALPKPVHPGAAKPATDETLQAEHSLLAAAYGLILELPPHAATVTAPTALNFHGSPELLLSTDGVAPHPQAHDVAADITLDGDDGIQVRQELLTEL
mmetsp:Transcript_31265/g.93086  ORF Transcript_31265/g.93086 Transcript_31265/m.93086 type:complete len:230 (+) Transcript_31265:121-810(+)